STRWPSNRAGQSASGQDRPQAKQVVGKDIAREERPVALLKVDHGLKGVAGERSVRSTKADGHQPSPQWIGETRSVVQMRKKPRTRLPLTLIKSVAQGNAASL